jgi:hypothetical protein
LQLSAIAERRRGRHSDGLVHASDLRGIRGVAG